jgi:phosphoglycolate phosphatase
MREIHVPTPRPRLCNEAPRKRNPEAQLAGRRLEAVIFDLDGTLVDTAPDLWACVNAMLARLERPPMPLEAVRPIAGDGVGALLKAGLEASGGIPDGLDCEAARQWMIEHYSAAPARFSPPFPGAVQCLQVLSERQLRLGLCTNKPARPTQELLRTLELDRFFDVVIGGDVLPVKKPDPAHLLAVLDHLETAPANAVMVGDTRTDRDAARAAGIACILVTYGYSSIPARELGAEHTIDSLRSLEDLQQTPGAA